MQNEIKPTPPGGCNYCGEPTTNQRYFHKECFSKMVNQSDHVKGLVEALKKIKEQTNETDGVFGLVDINHRVAKNALDDYRRATEGK